MKIVIFGAKGYLGQYFAEAYTQAITPRIDIADPAAVAEVLDAEKPDVIINCAGKTGRPNVDWCEDNKEATIRSNVTGPLVLLEETQKRTIYFVQVGSGCIYEGYNNGQGFNEEDLPNFIGSFYARSKAWIDQILKDFPVLTLRLRMPFDGTSHQRNFINKIKKYDRLIDVQNSITYLPDFIKASTQLMEKRATGIYNIVNPGTVSPVDVMNLYTEILDPSHTFTAISNEELLTITTAGRSNCSLSIQKLEAEGISMKPVEIAMREALETMKLKL